MLVEKEPQKLDATNSPPPPDESTARSLLNSDVKVKLSLCLTN
jgi:hypothetical protein